MLLGVVKLNFELVRLFITASKRSLGQGNIFTPVCHSVHRGEYLDRYLPGQVQPPGPGTPPRPGTPPQTRYTPPDQVQPPGPGTPPDQVPPQTRYTPQTKYTPNQVHPSGPGTPPGTRYTPQDQVHPPEQCMLGDTGNKRAVRILLECSLV